MDIDLKLRVNLSPAQRVAIFESALRDPVSGEQTAYQRYKVGNDDVVIAKSDVYALSVSRQDGSHRRELWCFDLEGESRGASATKSVLKFDRGLSYYKNQPDSLPLDWTGDSMVVTLSEQNRCPIERTP